MRMFCLGLGLFAVTLLVGWSFSSPAFVDAAPPQEMTSPLSNGAARGMIALSRPLENGDLQVVLIDAEKRVMSVYVVASGNGAITLKSVRNVQWDLLMEEYNGTKPFPREIKNLLSR